MSMKTKSCYFLAAFALAAILPAEATWTYVDNDGTGTYSGTVRNYSSNDKPYHGYITDGNCSIWVYQHDTENHMWTIGAGGFGVDGGNGGSVRVGTTGGSVQGDSSSLYSGDIDLSDANDAIVAATGNNDAAFTVIGRRCFRGYKVNFSLVGVPSTIGLINDYAFYQIGDGGKGLQKLDMRGCVLTEIGFKAFESQGSTANNQEFWFPETLTTIGGQALAYGPNKRTIHFLGDVPTLGDATALYAGSASKQWAYCVNALQYPSWNGKKTGDFDTGHKSWIPENVRYVNEDDVYAVDETTGAVTYPKPFGITTFGTTASETYLIQEGFAGETIPASSVVAVSDIGRTNATFTVTVDLGTSSEAILTFTVGGHSETETASAGTTTFTYTYYDFDLETTYTYATAVTAESGNSTFNGEMTTIGPDVKLGATSYSQTDDGLSATLTVNVSQLLAGTADVVLSLGGSDVEMKTVSATGDVSFDVSGLTLDQEYTYTFTATSSENGDVATAAVTFTARAYHWEYTPNGGETQAYPWDGTTPQPGNLIKPTGGQPYHGLLSDGYWTFYVYHHGDDADGEFWLGKGDSGSTAYSVAGRPALDLTKVYADTGIKLVRMGGFAFEDKDASVLRSIVLPKYMRHIVARAFYKAIGLTEIDLSNTQVTNIEQMAFQNCTSMTNVVLPATLQKLGGTALAWGPPNNQRVIHFLGDVPEVSPSESSGNSGTDQSLYIGYANKQQAYCVDAVKYPRWKTDATTTLYTTENPFPSATEGTWMAAHVRKGQPYANGKKTYDYPFGNSTLGRSYDTSTNGRAYLIQETQPSKGGSMMMFR